jgi:putative transcriptional regulator
MDSQLPITHDRPLDTLLASYAGGSLAPPLHALVGAHLELSPANRSFVSTLENAIAEDVLKSNQPLSRHCDMLNAIMAQPRHSEPAMTMEQGIMPRALMHYVGFDLDQVPWRWRMPGLRDYVVSQASQLEASFIWVKPGRRLPSHTHEGNEITLILKGGFRDASGHYARGDIAIASSDVDHAPIADEGEDCICFAVIDAPLTLTGPVARVFNRLFRTAKA